MEESRRERSEMERDKREKKCMEDIRHARREMERAWWRPSPRSPPSPVAETLIPWSRKSESSSIIEKLRIKTYLDKYNQTFLNQFSNQEKMNQVNGFESQEKEMEYEILFCHHCDDSLAGHR